MESVEIAVVGSGVAGAAAAWRLASRGREVVLFDQFEVGHVAGSSHGPVRIFRFVYEQPTYVRMAQLALPMWRELEEISGHELLKITGGLDAGSEEQLKGIAAALDASGASFEILEPRSRAERFPQIRLEEEFGLYSPDSGVLHADESVLAMVEAARAAGAEIRELTPILKVITGSDGVVLETPEGRLSAQSCVLAAGAWNGPLLRELGIPIPLQVTCEQVFYFTGEDVPVFIHRNGISYYSVPQFGGSPGIKVGEHATGPVTTAVERSFDIETNNAERVVNFVKRRLPGLDPEPVFAETCLYTLTPDQDFVIDKRGPLVIVSACSGHGFKFGPLLGEIVADLVTDQSPTVPIELFAISRFGA